jgi:hypothetical protein
MEASREFFIEQKPGFEIELSRGLEGALGREDEVLGAKKEFVDHDMSLVDSEKTPALGEFQELQLIDIEQLTDLFQEGHGFDEGFFAPEGTIACHGGSISSFSSQGEISVDLSLCVG